MIRTATIAGGALAALLCASGALADPLAMPHPDAIPFTAQEKARIAAVTALPTRFDAPEPFEARPGGAATAIGVTGPNAFLAPAANLSDAARLDFAVGQSLFEKLWVAAPSATRPSTVTTWTGPWRPGPGRARTSRRA